MSSLHQETQTSSIADEFSPYYSIARVLQPFTYNKETTGFCVGLFIDFHIYFNGYLRSVFSFEVSCPNCDGNSCDNLMEFLFDKLHGGCNIPDYIMFSLHDDIFQRFITPSAKCRNCGLLGSDRHAPHVVVKIEGDPFEDEVEDFIQPASKEAIGALQQVENLDGLISECSICLGGETSSADQQSKVLLRMPCDHLFHRHCLLMWLMRSNTCPYCRFQLPV